MNRYINNYTNIYEMFMIQKTLTENEYWRFKSIIEVE